MLQLSVTLRNASSRLTPLSSWRMPGQQLIAACSGAANPSPLLAQIKEEEPPARQTKPQTKEIVVSKNPLVQAAFNTLKAHKFGPKTINNKDISNSDSIIASDINSSPNVNGLLKLVDKRNVTQKNAFAMITLLIDWVNNGKAKLNDFERDTRFLRLCESLSNPAKINSSSKENENEETKRYLGELNLFYGINEIDEATKEVANITVRQMIKVMIALAQQKRRTTPLLRSLSFNISRSREVLNIKQLSDLLYSMAVLNYPDEVLLQKVSNDIMYCLNHVDKSAIIGSIITSLGILRYKNEELLDELSEWTVKHSNEIRPQDLCSFLMTLAVLGYKPTNVETLKKTLINPLKLFDITKPAEWLDFIWALTVLELAQNHHIASVLGSDFIRKLADSGEIPVPKKQKLLNINGVAQLLAKNYTGPLLESNSEIFTPPIQRSKEKQSYARSVTAAIENIFPPPEYLKLDIDFGMGFLLNAEFCIDSQGQRLPIESNLKEEKGLRVAVTALSYNDFCRGTQDPLGFYDLYSRMLKAKGYTILYIPYTEYSAEDKIAHRVTYINNRIKSIAN